MTTINNSDSANVDFRRRDVLRIGGYSALGVMLTLATGRAGFAQSANPSLDNIKANLSTLRYGEISPNYADAWPTTIGTVKGYFKEVGITDLKAILTEEYIPGLVSNSLDMTHSDTDRALSAAIASNMPIKIIGVFPPAGALDPCGAQGHRHAGGSERQESLRRCARRPQHLGAEADPDQDGPRSRQGRRDRSDDRRLQRPADGRHQRHHRCRGPVPAASRRRRASGREIHP